MYTKDKHTNTIDILSPSANETNRAKLADKSKNVQETYILCCKKE